MQPTEDLVHHAAEMARLAAGAARGYFRGRLGVEFKPDESPVTQADRGVEAQVRAYLAQHFPDHGIFGEEQGKSGLDRKHLWVIDPIDGTRSFLSGHPLFGFLLGHLIDGVPRIGVIGMPALNETYLGISGHGASRDGQAIRVSAQVDPDRAILYINEPERLYRNQPQVFDRLLKFGQTRRFAYDCYQYALLAAGHIDALVDYGLEPYDFLPVLPVVQAAGGMMTDWDGAPLTLNSGGRVVAAATPALHDALLDLVNG